MKHLILIALFVFCGISAQKILVFDSLRLKETQDFFADDYGNIYLYKNSDFSLTKYDSLGTQRGKLLFTLPFRIQSVQNPLNIPAFSENAQEMKFFDQNLTEIQTLNFRQHFGYIKMAYAEDLQQVWLLEESTKRLIQYNFREGKIINSYPFNIGFENITDLLVFEGKVYLLTKNEFKVYNFNAEKLTEIAFEQGKRLRRENDKILIASENTFYVFEQKNIKEIYRFKGAQIVDKNSVSYFVLKGNKLYLYPFRKDTAGN